jgi:hypothetical protein
MLGLPFEFSYFHGLFSGHQGIIICVYSQRAREVALFMMCDTCNIRLPRIMIIMSFETYHVMLGHGPTPAP